MASLSLFPQGVSPFDRTFTRAYNDQRGASINAQQGQRAFNTGFRALMRKARSGDPNALSSMSRLGPGYQRVGNIDAGQYGPAAQDRLDLNVIEADEQRKVLGLSPRTGAASALYTPPAVQPGQTGPAGGFGSLPTDPVQFGQVENVAYSNDMPDASTALQPAQPQSQYYGDIMRRKQEQIEQGMVPETLNLDEASQMDDVLRSRLTRSGLSQPRMSQLPTQTTALPGIGSSASYPTGETVVSGRYGTGISTPGASAGMTITENGKTITGDEWFKAAAGRQGIANKFAENEAQIRRIMGGKYVAPKKGKEKPLTWAK